MYLSICRTMALNVEVVAENFENSETVIKSHGLIDKPECINNSDKKDVQTEHSPQYSVTVQSRTETINASSRSAITATLDCGNALGTQLPPYILFKGKRMKKELLEGSSPGSDGTVSYSERSNSDVIMQYLKDHFVNYTQGGNMEKSLLLIFDGHKSHFNVPVIKWAQQKIYTNECHKYLRECPETKITRYNVAALGSSSYVKVLSNFEISIRVY